MMSKKIPTISQLEMLCNLQWERYSKPSINLSQFSEKNYCYKPLKTWLVKHKLEFINVLPAATTKQLKFQTVLIWAHLKGRYVMVCYVFVYGL